MYVFTIAVNDDIELDYILYEAPDSNAWKNCRSFSEDY